MSNWTAQLESRKKGSCVGRDRFRSTKGQLTTKLIDAMLGVYSRAAVEINLRQLTTLSTGFTKLICRRGDSNPHELPHTPLKRARLPVPPLRLIRKAVKKLAIRLDC